MQRLIRILRYAVIGASSAVLLGKLLQLITGLGCNCFLGNSLVAVTYGALGGAFFAFIYRPDLFAQQQSDEAPTLGA